MARTLSVLLAAEPVPDGRSRIGAAPQHHGGPGKPSLAIRSAAAPRVASRLRRRDHRRGLLHPPRSPARDPRRAPPPPPAPGGGVSGGRGAPPPRAPPPPPPSREPGRSQGGEH